MVEDGECFEDMNEYYIEIGQRVRQARGSRTQNDLARLAELNRMAVANIELGRQRIPVDVLDRLARALEVDVHDLLPGWAPWRAPLERLLPKERTAVELVRARAGLDDVEDAAG